MKKEDIVLLTNNFIYYFDEEFKKYYPPEPFVDNDGYFRVDFLAPQLNKVLRIKNRKKYYLFYVDPKSSYFYAKSNEENEELNEFKSFENIDNYLYKNAFSENYAGRVLHLDGSNLVAMKCRYNYIILNQAIKDMEKNVVLCDLIEIFAKYSKKNDKTGVYMFFSNDLYFYYIFKSGEFDSFYYFEKNREDYKPKSVNDETEDLGFLLSSMGRVRTSLKVTENSDFAIFGSEDKSEIIEDYLDTLAFNNIINTNLLLYIEKTYDEDVDLIFNNSEEKKKDKTSIFKYVPAFILSVCFAFLINSYFSNKKTIDILSDNLQKFSKSYEILVQKNIELKDKFGAFENQKAEYEILLSEKNFLDFDDFSGLIKELKNYGQIYEITYDNGDLVASIIADDDLILKDYTILKKIPQGDKFIYELKVQNDWF